MKKVLRIVSYVLFALVVLIAIDAASTVWGPGEIATGIQNHYQQNALKSELKEETEQVQKQQQKLASTNTINTKEKPVRVVLPRLEPGRAVGQLTGPHVNAYLTYGRAQSSIDKGPGVWQHRPGQGKTIMISGHRVTHGGPFRDIDDIDKGDVLSIKSPWGTWKYRVYRRAIVRPDTGMWVTRYAGFEQIVLTTCHPKYSAAWRYIVFAKLVDSPGNSI